MTVKSQATRKRFLIAGGTGSTGRSAVKILMEQGYSVRAFVHSEDERSASLRIQGADIVVGDLLNLDDTRNALEGVGAAYFVYPISPGLVEATAYFAQAAKEAGVGSIVNMSQISARRESKSHAARDHWIAERLFDQSGIPVTHLRPTFFAQNFIYFNAARPFVESGVISFPFGNGRHAPIAAEDQGRLIAAILADPTPHQGKTYGLHGPAEMDHFAIADIISEALGRTVKYQPIEIDQWRERLEQIPMPHFFVQHLCAVALDYRKGIFAGTDTIIEKVTGTPPMTFKAFLLSHREAFSPQGLPAKIAST
jgi:NAD(P)H dehydrogenase (quinone)